MDSLKKVIKPYNVKLKNINVYKKRGNNAINQLKDKFDFNNTEFMNFQGIGNFMLMSNKSKLIKDAAYYLYTPERKRQES